MCPGRAAWFVPRGTQRCDLVRVSTVNLAGPHGIEDYTKYGDALASFCRSISRLMMFLKHFRHREVGSR